MKKAFIVVGGLVAANVATNIALNFLQKTGGTVVGGLHVVKGNLMPAPLRIRNMLHSSNG